MKNYFFLENYVAGEGAVSHNVLYDQQLSIARITKNNVFIFQGNNIVSNITMCPVQCL